MPALGIEADNHRAAALAFAVNANRLDADADIAAADRAMRQNLFGSPHDRRVRNGEHPAPRSEHRHADQLAFGIDQRTAFGGARQGDVGADHLVDVAALRASPGVAGIGDHAQRGDAVRAVAADGDDQSACPRRCGDRRRDVASPPSKRRTATSVLGSRPANVALALLPSGNVISISSSLSSASSAVTTTPGFRMMPLAWPHSRPWTATTLFAVVATRSTVGVRKILQDLAGCAHGCLRM